jgi:hypothetical protein
MKENNGKGRRKKLMGKLIMIISSFAILIGLLTMLGFGRSKSKLLRTKTIANMVKKSNPSYDSRNNKPAWREDIHDQFLDKEESEVLEMILSAEIHLVDLHVDQEEVRRSPPNSYAGVYGSFCQLDFSIHKKDPSSGEYTKLYSISFGSFQRCMDAAIFANLDLLGYVLLSLEDLALSHICLFTSSNHYISSPNVP